MKAKDLPEAKILNLRRGKLLYSEDGVKLQCLPVTEMPICKQTLPSDEEEEEPNDL